MRKNLIAFDVDGTLEGYGGPIPIKEVQDMKRRAIVGLVSSRGDTHEIASRLGLDFSVVGKKKALKQLAKEFPDVRRKIYVGNALMDEIAARHASWEFIYARDYAREKLAQSPSK